MTASKLLDLMTFPTWQSRSSQCKSLPPVPRWAWRCWEGVSEGAVKYVATPSCCSSLWGFFLKADFRRTVSTATVRIHCTLGQTVSCRSRNRWQQPCRGEKRLKFERRKFHHAKEMCYKSVENTQDAPFWPINNLRFRDQEVCESLWFDRKLIYQEGMMKYIFL